MPFNEPVLLNSFSGPSREFLAREHNPDGTHPFGRAQPVKYTLASDGTTVTSYDQTGTVIGTPGTDGAAVLTGLLPAADAVGATIQFRNDGNAFPWRSSALLPTGITGRATIDGGGSLISLIGTDIGFLGSGRTGDGQTLKNLTVRRFAIDCASLTLTTHNVLIGTLNSAARAQRLNVQDILVEDVVALNAPVDTTGTHELSLVQFLSLHLATGETQSTLKRIYANRISMFGGNELFFVGGGYPGSLTGLNIYTDDIAVTNWYHDLGTTPTTSFPSNHIQIGWKGYGGRNIYVGPGHGRNSGDDGIEINAVQRALVQGVTIEDSFNEGFYVRNYNNPEVASSQTVAFRDCHAKKLGLATTVQASGFKFAIGTPNINLPALIVDGCSWYRGTTEAPIVGEAISFPGVGGFGSPRIVVRDFVATADQISISSGVTTGSFMDVNAQGPACRLVVDGFDATIAGAATGATPVIYAIRVANATKLVGSKIDGVRPDFNLTGAGANTLWGIAVGITGSALTVAGLTIRGFAPVQMVGDTAAHGIQVRGTSLVTILPGQFLITECDFTACVATKEIGYNVDAASNVVNTRVRANRWKTTPAPVAFTGLVTATGLALAQGWDAIATFTQGSGSAITALDYSTNGGTTYTNYLTQASAALPAGFDQSLGPLPSDALIKATFTTTQPTITLDPVNP